MSRLGKAKARRVLEILRGGTPPPPDCIHHLTVGREKETEYLKEVLVQASRGNPRTVFVRGEYGAGKSHILALMQGLALSSGFVTATVVLNSREQPLHRLHALYRRIATSLVLPDGPTTVGSMFSTCAASMLEKHRKDVHMRCRHGMRFFECSNFCLGQHLLDEFFPSLKKQQSGLSYALKLLVWATSRRDPELQEIIQLWLNGESLTRRDLARMHSGQAAGQVCLPPSLTDSDVMGALAALSELVGLMGINGLSVVLDEAEIIPAMGKGQEVFQAYLNLSRIVQVPFTGKGGKVAFTYATTPTFYHDIEKNFFEPLRRTGKMEQAADWLEENLHGSTMELAKLPDPDLLRWLRVVAALQWEAEEAVLGDDDWEKLEGYALELLETVSRSRSVTPRQYIVEWCRYLSSDRLSPPEWSGKSRPLPPGGPRMTKAEKEMRQFVCPICGKEFKGANGLNHHRTAAWCKPIQAR